MNKGIVLLLSPHHPVLSDKLISLGYQPEYFVQSDISALPVSYNQVVGIITSNTCFLPRQKIDLFPNLKFIGRLGSGMEIIDVAYAVGRGIACFGSPDGNANAVAEHALGMLLSLINHIHHSQTELTKGKFLRKENTGREISDLKVGIIGYGNNGKLFADILYHMGATIYAHDKVEKEIPYHDHYYFSTEVNDVIQHCNVISLHIPIDREAGEKVNQVMNGMRQPFILINCARGGLVTIDQLYERLKDGRITGACIDVWEEEPLDLLTPERLRKVNEILTMRNVIATPHIAGYTVQATYKMSRILADKIEAWQNF